MRTASGSSIVILTALLLLAFAASLPSLANDITRNNGGSKVSYVQAPTWFVLIHALFIGSRRVSSMCSRDGFSYSVVLAALIPVAAVAPLETGKSGLLPAR